MKKEETINKMRRFLLKTASNKDLPIDIRNEAWCMAVTLQWVTSKVDWTPKDCFSEKFNAVFDLAWGRK